MVEATNKSPFAKPNHEKFLGDGALYVWTIEDTRMPDLIAYLCNRLWLLRTHFHKVVKKAADEISLTPQGFPRPTQGSPTMPRSLPRPLQERVPEGS